MIWYGLVTPREVEAIVNVTLKEGKVIQELLRTGMGIAHRPNGVLDW